MRNNLASINKRIINIFAVDKPWVLVIILLLAIYVRLDNFIGVFRFDSYFYAQLSYFISQWDLNSFFFENNDFFAVGRLLLYFPTALLYRFFGVNDFTSVAFILLASLVSILVIYFLGKKMVNHKVGLVAAFLLSVYPLEVIYSTQYLPDGLITIFFSLAALSFLYGEDEKSMRRRALFYYLTGIFIGLAQYVRENAFVFVFVFGIYILYKRNFKPEYLLIAAGGLTMFVLSGLFFFIGTGDIFFQINQVIKQFSSSQERISSSERIIDWFGFTKILLSNGLFKPFSLIFVVSLIYSLIYKRKQMLFILIWFFALMFYLEVISQFHGLGKHDRYLSVITVPIVILTSSFLISMYSHFKLKLTFAIIFLISLLVSSSVPVRILSTNLTTNKHFVTYISLAESIEKEPIGYIYIEVLKHKGYIFNYVSRFNSLNYNSFQRHRVEGTNSLLIDWDGKEQPKLGSYVVVDAKKHNKLVKSNWKLITKKHKAYLYYVPLDSE